MAFDRYILLAHRDAPELRDWLLRAIGEVATVRQVTREGDLERALTRRPLPALVIASTAASLPAALATLAAARAAGVVAPFIIVAAFGQDTIHAFVSASGAQCSGYRVFSPGRFEELMHELLGRSEPSVRSAVEDRGRTEA